MLIHHEDGSKMAVETAKNAKMSNDGRCFIAYRSDVQKRKGIVELTATEMQMILSAASKMQTEAADKILRSL